MIVFHIVVYFKQEHYLYAMGCYSQLLKVCLLKPV